MTSPNFDATGATAPLRRAGGRLSTPRWRPDAGWTMDTLLMQRVALLAVLATRSSGQSQRQSASLQVRGRSGRRRQVDTDRSAARESSPRAYLRRQLLSMVALAMASLILTPTVAHAEGPTPGEDLASAAGPVTPEGTVSGTFATGNEEDWWFVQLRGASQITLTVGVRAAKGNTCFGADWNFTDYFGRSLDNGYFTVTDGSESTHVFKYTTPPTPEVATYYLERSTEDGGVGCPYTWSIAPASAVVTNPPAYPALVAESEPNDQAPVANGPLLVWQRYEGAITTSNDVDNVYFNAMPSQNVTLELTGRRGCSPSGVEAKVAGPFSTGTTLSASSNNRSDRVLTTAVYGGRYNVAISGQQGCRWQLQALAGQLSVTPVLPGNGGAPTIAGAPPVKFGQIHQGGDMPIEYWKVPRMFPGDHLLLQFSNTGDAFSHDLTLGLFAPNVTDLFATKAKPAFSTQTRGPGMSPAILKGTFTGSGTLFVREGSELSSDLPAFSFVPIVLAHRTTIKLNGIPRTTQRHAAVIVTAHLRSAAGVPIGVCQAFDAHSHRRLARVKSVRGRCRLRIRFLKSGHARLAVSFRPSIAEWLASSTTARVTTTIQ